MGWYARAVDGAGRRPWLVSGAALAIVVAVVTLFAIQPHKVLFFLDEDPDFVAVYVKARATCRCRRRTPWSPRSSAS